MIRHLKAVAVLTAILTLTSCSGFFESETAKDELMQETGLYSVEATSLSGETTSLGQFEGKVALVVNVASECGFTPQYEGLQKLHETYGERGLVVLGFPSNEFGGQEPGSAEEIQQFCSSRFEVTFPMFAKVQTKEGDGQSPVYSLLGGATGSLPGWNFCKYLVSRDGKTATFFDSRVAPDDAELVAAIENALKDG